MDAVIGGATLQMRHIAGLPMRSLGSDSATGALLRRLQRLTIHDADDKINA